MKNIIEVSQLSKKYKTFEAVKNISFSIKEGEFFGFLGPNGAGKSTTMNMLCTMLEPTSGTAYINGFDVVNQSQKVRENIGIVFQENTLDSKLTANENLLMHCKYYDVLKSERKERINTVLEMVGLLDKKDKIVGIFSGGMKRRLEIARGLLHYPRVLFLDEPTIGLDPQTKTYIWEYIFNIQKKQKTTIILTTHYMDEAEACDRVAIMDDGKIIELDSPTKLKNDLGGDVIELHSSEPEKLIQEIKNKYGIDAIKNKDVISFNINKGDEFVVKLLKEINTSLNSVNFRRPTLNDVFLELTGRKIRDI